MSEMTDYIQKYTALLPRQSFISQDEAEKKAGEFLCAQAKITEWKHLLTSEKIKLLSLQTATYATEMSKGTAKTVTENKLTAEASVDYVKAREELEQVENDLSYLRSFYDIFNNAHIFYRNLAKGEIL